MKSTRTNMTQQPPQPGDTRTDSSGTRLSAKRRFRKSFLATALSLQFLGVSGSAYAIVDGAPTSKEIKQGQELNKELEQQPTAPQAPPAEAQPAQQPPKKQLVTYEDAGGPTYIGIQWSMGTDTTFGLAGGGPSPITDGSFAPPSKSGPGGLGGLTSTASPNYKVSMTIRINGQIECQDQQEVSALYFSKQVHKMCGKEVKIEGFSAGSTLKAYYREPGEEWGKGVDSPAHCENKDFFGFSDVCHHYLYGNG